MTIDEMKNILAQKLKDEGCYFTKKDISITSYKKGYKIVIADYDHIPFYMHADPPDDFFGHIVYVWDEWSRSHVVFIDNHEKPDYESALIELGHHIGITF